ncbi:hypothetical protein QYM36_011674 [Artemia franciscana]|uniref:PiggyBac transposable element-derived protein domain-containing protein n=1 Tax=Artemia franciscana TaxID=6661 RepID=A0AA88HSC9_ARTSF|nr:hypothetical protein QYM36_011674 [Artemia franciscana]
MAAKLVDQTNLDATGTTNARIALKLTQHEMSLFLGKHMLMSIVKPPAMRMYWEGTIRYTPISEAMSHDRFLTIRQFFHINDDSLAVPSDQTSHDKLYKIRPTYDKLRENLRSIPPEERQSVDEQIIPFKGRLSFKQYLKDKPHS